jgi:hypothetical protein
VKSFDGLLTELRFDESGVGIMAWIACIPQAVPAPGRYIMALGKSRDDWLSHPLFSAGSGQGGFLAAPPIPSSWRPGDELYLHGPYGRGFSMPAATRRLALVSLGITPARLMPLVRQALEDHAAVALFADGPTPEMPPAVEVNALRELPEALGWCDYLAVDLPIERWNEIRMLLRLGEGAPSLSIPAQVLVAAEMPCAGMADCGVCALSSRKKMRLACKHGPVFELEEILRPV